MDKLKEFRSEVFFGLVAPVGIDLTHINDLMKKYLSNKFKYKVHTIQLSGISQKVPNVTTKIDSTSEYTRIKTGMDAGNEARQKNSEDILAQYSMIEVQTVRYMPEEKAKLKPPLEPKQENAYIFRSIKNPKEAILFRSVYGKGLFILGFFSARKKRQEYLTNIQGMTLVQAEELIKRDEDEQNEDHGQHTRDTFYTSDAFFNIDDPDFPTHLKRFLDLIFGDPHITPTEDEFSMFMAFASSFRSSDLSRQVGAVIVSKEGEIIATGCNDVPKKGGGLYWCGDPNDARDFQKGIDPNAKRRDKIAETITKSIQGLTASQISEDKIKKILKESGVYDITEYGRAVHAEMEALLSCSRAGISPREGTIYSTTFPCHNCAKHIVASGIGRVVFVEPYPKSKAIELHGDAIEINKEYTKDAEKVTFQTFIGIGPRRFLDLFSLELSSGVKIERKKDDGKIVDWKEEKSIFRFPLLGMSYLQKEISIGAKVKKGGENE